MNEYKGWQVGFDSSGYFALRSGLMLLRADHLWQIRDQIDIWDDRLKGNLQ